MNIYPLRGSFALNLTAIGLSVTVSSGMVGPFFSCVIILVRGGRFDVTRQGSASLYSCSVSQTRPLFNKFLCCCLGLKIFRLQKNKKFNQVSAPCEQNQFSQSNCFKESCFATGNANNFSEKVLSSQKDLFIALFWGLFHLPFETNLIPLTFGGMIT
jgi:hypothetical protein